MTKAASLLLTLGLFSISLQAQKESKVYKFEDGTEITFQYLSEKSADPLPWRVGLGIYPGYLPFLDLNFGFNLAGAYQVNEDLQLLGSLGYINPGDEAADNSFAKNYNGQLGAYYTFAKSKGVKRSKIQVAGRSDGFTEISYFLEDVPLRRRRFFEVYAGISQFNTPVGANVRSNQLDLPAQDSLINGFRLNRFSSTTLDIGISARSLIRSFFGLNDRLRSATIDSRWTAKMMIPLQRTFSTTVFRENGMDVFNAPVETDRGFFENHLSTVGFALEYDTYRTSSFTGTNLLYGYHFGLKYHPFVQGVEDLYPMVQIHLGFSIGYTNNPRN